MTSPSDDTDVVRACRDCARTNRVIVGRGLCSKCYRSRSTRGTLDMVPMIIRPTNLDHLLAWLPSMRDVPGCWRWPLANMHGYGRVRVDGRAMMAHRYVYELLVGPIPTSLFLDHTCHNATESCSDDDRCPHRACVNPAHLEPVTPGENTNRGHTITARNLTKTHCPYGHPYSGDNLRTIGATGARVCRECSRRKARLRRRRIRR